MITKEDIGQNVKLFTDNGTFAGKPNKVEDGKVFMDTDPSYPQGSTTKIALESITAVIHINGEIKRGLTYSEREKSNIKGPKKGHTHEHNVR